MLLTLLAPQGAGAGITGTIAATTPIAIAAMTGTFTPPTVSGTIAGTAPVAAASFAGIVGAAPTLRKGNFFLLLGDW